MIFFFFFNAKKIGGLKSESQLLQAFGTASYQLSTCSWATCLPLAPTWFCQEPADVTRLYHGMLETLKIAAYWPTRRIHFSAHLSTSHTLLFSYLFAIFHIRTKLGALINMSSVYSRNWILKSNIQYAISTSFSKILNTHYACHK